jgi:hypothetical protein
MDRGQCTAQAFGVPGGAGGSCHATAPCCLGGVGSAGRGRVASEIRATRSANSSRYQSRSIKPMAGSVTRSVRGRLTPMVHQTYRRGASSGRQHRAPSPWVTFATSSPRPGVAKRKGPGPRLAIRSDLCPSGRPLYPKDGTLQEGFSLAAGGGSAPIPDARRVDGPRTGSTNSGP